MHHRMRDGVTGIGPVDDLVRLAVDGQDRARLPVGDPDLVLRPVREETVRVAVLGGDDVLDLPGRRIDHRGRTATSSPDARATAARPTPHQRPAPSGSGQGCRPRAGTPGSSAGPSPTAAGRRPPPYRA